VQVGTEIKPDSVTFRENFIRYLIKAKFIHIFICSLFNDAFSVTQTIQRRMTSWICRLEINVVFKVTTTMEAYANLGTTKELSESGNN